MGLFVPMTPQERKLEEAADLLIRSMPRDPDHPAYTERQLDRRGPRLISVDGLLESRAALAQSLADELRFLMSVSHLQPIPRLCLRMWSAGHDQQEIAQSFGMSQQRVSQYLRRALLVCYDNAPISFRQFSHHSIYRRPSRVRRYAMLRRCAWCGDEFPAGLGSGRFCSIPCRERSMRRE